jgi:aminocarboxymuconate-semialdehyde decarboxylase
LGDLEIGKFIEESDLTKNVQEDIFHQSTLDWLKLDKQMFV